jgi:hypothetical protein
MYFGYFFALFNKFAITYKNKNKLKIKRYSFASEAIGD